MNYILCHVRKVTYKRNEVGSDGALSEDERRAIVLEETEETKTFH